jgi:hypothetical protein
LETGADNVASGGPLLGIHLGHIKSRRPRMFPPIASRGAAEIFEISGMDSSGAI